MKKLAGRWLLLAIISIFCLLQIVMLLDADVSTRSSLVRDGVLDARDWHFAEDGLLRLDGDWRFYANELADPLALPTERSALMPVPRDWRDSALGQPAHGNGTYELLVHVPSSYTAALGLKVSNIRMSHRLYVNGQLLYENGVPAADKASHRPSNTPYTIYAQPEDGQLHLVIQVSNYKYYQGGIAQPILLGTVEQISRHSLINFGVGMSGFMMTVCFGLYALLVFLMRPQERIYLYAGLFFLAVSLVVACADEKVLMVLLEWLPFEVAYKMQDYSLSGAMLLLFAFFRTVAPAFLPKKVHYALAAPLLLNIIVITALPYEWYVLGKAWISPYQMGLCVLAIVRWSMLLWAAKQRDTKIEYVLMLFTALFVSGSLVFHYLFLEQVMSSRLLSFASYFSFIFTINLFLALCSTNVLRRTEELSQQLWEANKAKSDFLQRTSHELKTPLHGIRNLTEHLFEHAEQLTDEQRRQLGLVVDTTSRLSYIVNDLVDAAQLRNASVHIRMASVDLSAVADHVLRVVSFQIGDKPVTLVNRVPERVLVEADEPRLQQIMYNLVSNAVKYSHEGVVVATASVNGDSVTLHVADPGVGIAEEEWELVFQDTYRSDAPGQPLVEGMGLGLFISRGLARGMNGDLYIASSEPGHGTKMALELKRAEHASGTADRKKPARASAAEAAGYKAIVAGRTAAAAGRAAGVSAAFEAPAASAGPAASEAGGGRGGSGGSGGGKMILLVDDDPANIEVLRLILQDDYGLALAYSAEQALAVIERQRIDLVIADLIMPGMSGVEFTRRVRQRHSALALPIIIATANAFDNSMQLAYMAGATDYIAKPFAAGEIRKRVQLLLQLSTTMETALRHERDFLAAQIKPHFLYNALNNIIAVCYDEPERAAELLTLLSRHLRRMFQQESTAHTVTLRQELDLVLAYVEIEKLRFEERLRFAIELDPALETERQRVKTLLIQPLVENAIAHGLFNKVGAGTVTLRITKESDVLQIVVQDDGVGMEPVLVERLLSDQAERGVGLTNVRRRTASVPGAEFSLRSAPGKGTTCTIKLPLE